MSMQQSNALVQDYAAASAVWFVRATP